MINKLPVILSSLALIIGVAALGLTLASGSSTDDDLTAKVDSYEETISELNEKLDDFEQQEGFSVNDAVNPNGYQAVFLESGEVYFGKLADGEPGQLRLGDIYYLQGAEYDQGGSVSGATEISLAKLGNELHGPEDVMHIPRENVNFWENMKDDGQVVQAIKAYQEGF